MYLHCLQLFSNMMPVIYSHTRGGGKISKAGKTFSEKGTFDFLTFCFLDVKAFFRKLL